MAISLKRWSIIKSQLNAGFDILVKGGNFLVNSNWPLNAGLVLEL